MSKRPESMKSSSIKSPLKHHKRAQSTLPKGHKRQSSQAEMKKVIKDWVRATISRPPYDITIKNLTKSWADGLAFAALIHSLSTIGRKKEPYKWTFMLNATPLKRLELAFDSAKQILRVEPLLDADDTVGYQDSKSILLYLTTIRTKVAGSTGSYNASTNCGSGSGSSSSTKPNIPKSSKPTTSTKSKSKSMATTNKSTANSSAISLAKRAEALRLKMAANNKTIYKRSPVTQDSVAKKSAEKKTITKATSSLSRANRLKTMKGKTVPTTLPVPAPISQTTTSIKTQKKLEKRTTTIDTSATFNKPTTTASASSSRANRLAKMKSKTSTTSLINSTKPTKPTKSTKSTKTPPAPSTSSTSAPVSSRPTPIPTHHSSTSSSGSNTMSKVKLRSIRRQNNSMSKRISVSMVLNATTVDLDHNTNSEDTTSKSRNDPSGKKHISKNKSQNLMNELTGITEDHQTAIFHPDNQHNWMSGWAWKLGKWSALGKGVTKKRYFVLENTQLAYWKSKHENINEKGNQRNSIQLMSIEAVQTCYVVHAASSICGRYGLHIMTAERVYTMMLETIQDRDLWMVNLLDSLARLGHPLLLSRISRQFDRTKLETPIISNNTNNNTTTTLEEEEERREQMFAGLGMNGSNDTMDGLKETIRIYGTKTERDNERKKRIPICPALNVSTEIMKHSMVTNQEERKTMDALQQSTFHLYSEVHSLLLMCENVHVKSDEIGIVEDDIEDGLLALITNVGASLEKINTCWKMAEEKSKEHTTNMQIIYKNNIHTNNRIAETDTTTTTTTSTTTKQYWLPTDGGWLLKPDFKKCKMTHWNAHRGLLKYQKRWFIIQDNALNYYKSDPKMSRSRKIVKPKGSIDLSIIIAVRPSLAPKAPIWSLDVLTSTGEIYILGTESKQEQLLWGVHLTRYSKCSVDPAFQGIV